MCEPLQPHDFIQHYSSAKPLITEKASGMYREGYSLSAISASLNVSKNRVRKALLDHGVELRLHSNDQRKSTKGAKPAFRNAPYGYCLVRGRLHEDPREMAIVLDILKWWRQGMSHGAIARKLNGLKVPPRKAGAWSQPTIGFIIKREAQKPKPS